MSAESGPTPFAVAADPAIMRRIFAPALVLAALALVATHMAWLEFGGHLHDVRVSLRLFSEDRHLALAGLVVLGLAPLVTARIAGFAQRLARWFDAHSVLVAGLATLALGLGAILVSQRHPFSADEFAALFQSRVFAAGDVAGRMPPAVLEHAFGKDYLGFFYTANRETGQVITNYWPGFALLLSPFTRAGVPWLLNPLIGGLTLLAVHRLARALFPDSDAAGYAVLFTLASPAFVINATSFYSMPTHLLANTIFATMLLVPDSKRLFLAGLVGGYALLLHHPYPHALFAAPWIVWLATTAGRGRRLTSLAAGYLVVLLVVGGFWVLAHARIAPDSVDAEALAGGQGGLAGLVEAVRYAFVFPDSTVLVARTIDLIKVTVWSAPALLVLAMAGAWFRRDLTGVRLLCASALLMLAGYLIVFFDQGAGWSSRYFHPAWAALPVLAAGAVATRRSPWQLRHGAGLRAFSAATALAGLLVMNGTAAWMVRGFMIEHLEQRPVPAPGGRHVIVLNNTAGYYVRDLVQNDPWLRDPVIWLDGVDAPPDLVPRLFPHARHERTDPMGDIWRLQ